MVLYPTAQAYTDCLGTVSQNRIAGRIGSGTGLALNQMAPGLNCLRELIYIPMQDSVKPTRKHLSLYFSPRHRLAVHNNIPLMSLHAFVIHSKERLNTLICFQRVMQEHSRDLTLLCALNLCLKQLCYATLHQSLNSTTAEQSGAATTSVQTRMFHKQQIDGQTL